MRALHSLQLARSHRAPSCRPGRPGAQHVVCMAEPRRVARVASAIQREVGDLLAHDPLLQEAVSPNRSHTDAVSAVAGVTDVHITNDLSHAKIYLSIYSNAQGRRAAFRRIKKLEPYVRHVIGQRIPLRLVPEIRLIYDDTLEEQELVQKVLAEEEQRLYGPKPDPDDNYGEEEEEEDEEAFFEDPKTAAKEERGFSSEDIFTEPGPFDGMFSGTNTPRRGRGGASTSRGR